MQSQVHRVCRRHGLTRQLRNAPRHRRCDVNDEAQSGPQLRVHAYFKRLFVLFHRLLGLTHNANHHTAFTTRAHRQSLYCMKLLEPHQSSRNTHQLGAVVTDLHLRKVAVRIAGHLPEEHAPFVVL